MFTPPARLTQSHIIEGFASGETSLDDWLRNRALENMAIGASQTYVICERESLHVIGYYALCMGQVLHQDVTGSMRRNMPRQIPAVIMGRLAVDQSWHGKGLGAALLQDAVLRSARAAKEVSARLIIVHAISPEAEAFYQHFGFTPLPTDTPTLALDLVKFDAVRKT